MVTHNAKYYKHKKKNIFINGFKQIFFCRMREPNTIAYIRFKYKDIPTQYLSYRKLIYNVWGQTFEATTMRTENRYIICQGYVVSLNLRISQKLFSAGWNIFEKRERERERK